tara:strand:- start:532 stop:954 length:423 start_codon:yes stop_codon:yes gene_type:complete
MIIYIEIDKRKIIKCSGFAKFDTEEGNTLIEASLPSDDGLDESKRFVDGVVVENLLPTQEDIDKKLEEVEIFYCDSIFRSYKFNEKYLSDFIALINVYNKEKITSIEWKTKDSIWVNLSIADAHKISILAIKEIQKIYKG